MSSTSAVQKYMVTVDAEHLDTVDRILRAKWC